MGVFLDHTIVPVRDNEIAAKFFASMFGLEYAGPWGHFAPVKVNGGTLSLDFDSRENFERHHYAFLVTDGEFDAILSRVKTAGRKFGSGPGSQEDMEINHHHMGRGFYFRCDDGHSWEVITHTYTTPTSAGTARASAGAAR
ncbi:MAG: VOC family protein [Dehalococcoidia bacterium]|nr:VOC family protein [Dehalococcoidia bacterium]